MIPHNFMKKYNRNFFSEIDFHICELLKRFQLDQQSFGVEIRSDF